MNVIKLKRENNALDIALMVESATRTERQEYDETTIVEALVREAGCDRNLAKECDFYPITIKNEYEEDRQK